MQLLLHVETASNIDTVLAAAYAFDPHAFKHIGNGTLEATIDASHDLSQAQIDVIAASKYEITFVLPSVTPPAMPSTTPTPTPDPTPTS
jgi:hypothetical protein